MYDNTDEVYDSWSVWWANTFHSVHSKQSWNAGQALITLLVGVILLARALSTEMRNKERSDCLR